MHLSVIPILNGKLCGGNAKSAILPTDSLVLGNDNPKQFKERLRNVQ